MTYHYVRKLEDTKYPLIKGLDINDFMNQIDYYERNYTFIGIQDIINNLYYNEKIPNNPILLTFDDGYIDHFTNVLPILKKKRIKGCFFPSAKPIQENKVLSVNKIQFILASEKVLKYILDDIYDSLDCNRNLYNLKSNRYYFELLTRNLYGSDNKEITFIKRLLQKGLDKDLRELIIDRLFNKYVTSNEESFANELYMDISQIEYMIDNGMNFGSHGYEHCWLNTISPKEQERDVDSSLIFLKNLGVDFDNLTMCYPHGAYNNSLIRILKGKKFKLAFTINGGIAKINKKYAFKLKRFDANYFS